MRKTIRQAYPSSSKGGGRADHTLYQIPFSAPRDIGGRGGGWGEVGQEKLSEQQKGKQQVKYNGRMCVRKRKGEEQQEPELY